MQESGEKEKRNNYLKGHRSREAHTHTHIKMIVVFDC